MFTIVLARQGQTMERGTLVKWCKELGEDFLIGEDLFEVESEKAVIVVQATRRGRLVRMKVAADESVPVGALLAVAADPGEQVTAAAIDCIVTEFVAEPIAAEDGGKLTRVSAPARPAAASRTVAAIPKARALATQLGIDLSSVVGSGPDGAITVNDVQRAGESRKGELDPPGIHRISRRARLTPIGRSVLAALDRGARTPQFTQGVIVDATQLVRRKQMEGDASYMDLFLEALIRAAKTVPEVLASVAERETEFYDSIDVSIATATEHGLLLPVLHDAGRFDAKALREAWRTLVQRARDRRLAPADLAGGTIALSNLGSRGVDYGVPLLPADHAVIVFVGTLAPRPHVVGSRLEVCSTVHLGITYDHRVIDGVLGSRFTDALRGALEGV